MKLELDQQQAQRNLNELRQALALRGEKLSFAVQKNIDHITSAGKAEYESHLAPAERTSEYHAKLKVLQVNHADKDEDGELVIDKDTGQVAGLPGNEDFHKAAEALSDEYKDVIDGRTDAENSKFEVEIHMVKRISLPKDISGIERGWIKIMTLER